MGALSLCDEHLEQSQRSDDQQQDIESEIIRSKVDEIVRHAVFQTGHVGNVELLEELLQRDLRVIDATIANEFRPAPAVYRLPNAHQLYPSPFQRATTCIQLVFGNDILHHFVSLVAGIV